MCELDFDVTATVWDERLVARARKPHSCDTCRVKILAGESYIAHFSVFEGDANVEKQCLRCRTIANAFEREHHYMISPGSLLEYLEECIDEERWAADEDDEDEDREDDEDEDREVPLTRLPSRLSETGLRWKHSIAEIWSRREAARAA